MKCLPLYSVVIPSFLITLVITPNWKNIYFKYPRHISWWSNSLCLVSPLHWTLPLAFLSSQGQGAANTMLWLENRNQAYQFTCTNNVAPMPERPPKRNLIPLGIVFWSAILPLKKILVKVAHTVHEQYKDSAVGPDQYHLLITLDCCCLSYRMFDLIFKSMSIPGERTVNILFLNII